MDKNTVIGFLLIAAIVIGFTWLNKPSEEELARRKQYNDSIALVQQEQYAQQMAADSIAQLNSGVVDSVALDNDSVAIARKMDAFGGFGESAFGEEEFITLENELVKLTFTNKGGRVYSAELKEHKAQEGKPLILFDEDESNLNFVLATNTDRTANTSELYFTQASDIVKDAEGNQTLTLRLNTNSPESYIDFIYSLPANDYMLKYDVKATNMNQIMPMSINSLEMQWVSKIRQQEKGRSFEERYSSLSYKFLTDDVNKLSPNKNDRKKLDNQIKWIAFKDQYFTSVLIADKSFTSTMLASHMMDKNSGYMKSYEADMVVPFDLTGKEPTGFKFYFGPVHHKTLADYDKGVAKEDKLKLRELVPLGWGIFGWVNRYFVIPMFNFFSKFIDSFGIIILLMTIVIKLVLFPLSYKSYMSSAKMRVLKPEIDAINAKIPPEKAMERQKATMELYNKVGVSPMSGCLPMLLSMPVLIAMFSFFPSAIELRQQSFLWAKDLSAYDAIITWKANIPLISSIFNNHISLFAVLMMVTTIFSTKISMANTQPAGDQPGANMMKYMMYLMPVMFFFMFNSYASGLTYYYSLSALITIIQNEIIKATVNEEKLLAELHAKGKANEKKPRKSGGFMERLERMQKEQQRLARENARNRKR